MSRVSKKTGPHRISIKCSEEDEYIKPVLRYWQFLSL